MEVDADINANIGEYLDGNVMASNSSATTSSGSVTVSLHPLVIMNISEHFTRIRAQEGKAQQVVGALIGQHKGRHLEIMNSFELVFQVIDGLIVIDRDYYRTKEEQFKQVFSHMDFLGWYTTGNDSPTPSDIHVQKQICEINESPVFLKLNPFIRNSSDLPISIYESVIDLVNGETKMLFVQLSYVLATEEAERIGVDHVARVSTSDNQENSNVAEHLSAQHSAIKMLYSRVKLILEYIKAAEKGEVPVCHEALRLAYSLSHRLPVINEERFKPDFYEQCCDVGLITYLGMITKGCEEANQYITRFNMLHSSRRMRETCKRYREDASAYEQGKRKSASSTNTKLRSAIAGGTKWISSKLSTDRFKMSSAPDSSQSSQQQQQIHVPPTPTPPSIVVLAPPSQNQTANENNENENESNNGNDNSMDLEDPIELDI